MIKAHATLRDLDLTNQRVFLRADLNVPLNNGEIINDYRLAATLPTIDLISQKGGRIILATHAGRPKGPTPLLSTKLFLPWFIEKGYAIRFEPELEHATFDRKPEASIILLENLRFYPGEKDRDKAFAQQLCKLADYYINDAFAVLHRNDTSVTLLPQLFPRDRKAFGLLVEQELQELSKLRNPEQPFVVVSGGGKVKDKIPLLKAMLGKAQVILLCPAIVFTFLKSQGFEVGKSLVDKEALDEVKEILNNAAEKGTKVIFPVDYQVALDSLEGKLTTVSAQEIPSHGIGMNIGPATEKLFTQEIQRAKTVFFNGLPGVWNRPETLDGSRAVIKAMADSPAFTVIGGGDSIALAEQLGLAHRMGYCSTGGGATLAYVAGEELPGLAAMQ